MNDSPQNTPTPLPREASCEFSGTLSSGRPCENTGECSGERHYESIGECSDEVQKEAGKVLRWGYSTGACVAALATAAWLGLEDPSPRDEIRVLFLDGQIRILPLLPSPPSLQGSMFAIRKDGGDDPDCTDGAIIFGSLQASHIEKARPEDYILHVDTATIILRASTGIGLCTRLGLDCEQGKWAINTGPRQMIVNNLYEAGMRAGCWLFECGVEHGKEIAKHSLNTHLGILNGISILGTTGLVRPYSHDAYIETIRICVRSNHLSKGRTMVFCTGGRTKSGAQKQLPTLPETAFTCIGDFIAESLVTACQYEMQEVIVACMPGKLCKYAAGFANTHAHKVTQDMQLLRKAVQTCLPDANPLHEALEHSVSVREALVSIPEDARLPILHQLARTALQQFAKHCASPPTLRILIFDFAGQFMFEESCKGAKEHAITSPIDKAIDTFVDTNISISNTNNRHINATDISERYFLERNTQ